MSSDCIAERDENQGYIRRVLILGRLADVNENFVVTLEDIELQPPCQFGSVESEVRSLSTLHAVIRVAIEI
jgi:hypothetical protein